MTVIGTEYIRMHWTWLIGQRDCQQERQTGSRDSKVGGRIGRVLANQRTTPAAAPVGSHLDACMAAIIVLWSVGGLAVATMHVVIPYLARPHTHANK